MKQHFLKFGIMNGLILLAILFSLIAVGSLLASAHNAQSTSSAANAPSSAACQQYLQGLSQRLSIPVSTLERQVQMTRGDTLAHSPCN
jgi:hypothetical protein